MLRLAVKSGQAAGRTIDASEDVVRIGRALSNDLVVDDTHVSAEHARVVVGISGMRVEDSRSTNGTSVLRDGSRIPVDDGCGRKVVLQKGDIIELGSGDATTLIEVELIDEEEAEARVIAMRKLHEIERISLHVEQNPRSMAGLYAAQKRIGAASGLDDTLEAIADAAFALVPQATHVTVVLRDDAEPSGDVFVPVLSRSRGGSGAGRGAGREAVPIARSVYRKVIAERAAVLAADAPRDVGGAESLIGASIRSTVGVPLYRGDEILGVLQVDNRDAPGRLNEDDVEVLGVLAANASLAVAAARLIRRLSVAEERLEKENVYLKRREESRRTGDRSILGDGPAMRALLEQIDKVVDTRVTVLIEGETGTGKELVASALHYRSRRKDKLFVTQNCAALPEQLLESELFGHKRGAFTGATDDRRGLFEIADGGTLFLDEVTEMPPSLQSKLLRVLQEGEVRPLGASQPKYVNVRIVAATNRDAEKEVAAGRLREDLFYRLKVFPLRVPPLRERREDVPVLAKAFLDRYAREIGKSVAGFAEQAMQALVVYDWPGNVRELQNEVQRLVIEAEPNGFITTDLLSSRVRRVETVVLHAKVGRGGKLKEMVDEVEKYLLLEALREHDQNKTSTARALGITREGLHKKLKQLGIG